MNTVDRTLHKLAELISQGRYEAMETEGLEIKPVPSDGNQWREIHKSVNAFLNTRGGIAILGIKEEGQGRQRRYAFAGYREEAEPKIKEIAALFTDRKGQSMDVSECLASKEIRDFMDGRVAVIYIDELPADRKFCFYHDKAYKRDLTGDHVISNSAIEAQEEYKEELIQARELAAVPGVALTDLDMDRLNEYIQRLNRTTKIETIKADLDSAMAFLERKCFVKNGAVTTLGMLVCGKHPGDYLGFRCQVHGYVDAPHVIARDKQDLADNILPLMEASVAFIWRNIQVGINAAQGGVSVPQYPEELLRETVNNALAHRDYSINKQVIISIKPGAHIAIRNPGAFRKHLLLEDIKSPIPLRRIIPEAKPRNPKLADVLKVYQKWEGRGIGMATLVNLCVQNQIDLPYFRFYSEEVCLYLCCGKLLDERMERLFQSFDGYIEAKLRGRQLTEQQKLVLSYIIKSEWANEQERYTILLTPDNNHFGELAALGQAGLIIQHPLSASPYIVYIADRTLIASDYIVQLREMFGASFDSLDNFFKEILNVVYRFNHFSKIRLASPKRTSFALWMNQGKSAQDIQEFDRHYRKVRYSFNKLEKWGFVINQKNGKVSTGYQLNKEYMKNHLGENPL